MSKLTLTHPQSGSHETLSAVNGLVALTPEWINSRFLEFKASTHSEYDIAVVLDVDWFRNFWEELGGSVEEQENG